MRKNSGFILLCLSYLLYFITMGVYSPYLNLYYERVGLSGSQIGLIHSCGYIAAMLLSPIWGSITDRTHKYKSMISFLMLATSFTAIIWQRQSEFLWIFILSLFLNIFRSNIGNVFDGFSVEYCNQNGLEFSWIRSMGSLGYLVGSFLIGNLLFEVFHISGPYIQVMFVSSVLMVFLLFFVKSPIFNDVKEKHDLKSNMIELLHNKDYLFILIMAFFTIWIQDSAVNYIGNHLIMSLHLEDSSIGINICAMVLPEVFIIMVFHRYLRRFGLKSAFILATLTQVIRFVVYAYTSNFYLFMLASLVHGIMIAVGTVGIITFIHKKVPTYMLATAMTLYGGFSVISYALQSQLFGFVYQLWGSNIIFLITALFTCIALLMSIKTKRFE